MRTAALFSAARKSPAPGHVGKSHPFHGVLRHTLAPGKGKQMAKQTTVTLIDDLDGSVAEEQVEFAVDGRSYEIDLSAANSARLRDLLAPFVSAARRTGGRRSPAAGPSRS